MDRTEKEQKPHSKTEESGELCNPAQELTTEP